MAMVLLWGCAGDVQAKVDVLPPTPVPQPALADDGGQGQAADDRCPDEEEDGLPPDRSDGCKTTDPDGDGVVGSADQCPHKAETKNDYRDDDGCPDELPEIYLAGNEIMMRGKPLEFAGTILSAAAVGQVAKIVAVLTELADVELLEVGVHTVGSGSGPASMMYAKARAGALVKALVKAGIAADRLRAKGYGGSCKLDTGRVDLTVVRRAGKDTGADLGCDKPAK